MRVREKVREREVVNKAGINQREKKLHRSPITCGRDSVSDVFRFLAYLFHVVRLSPDVSTDGSRCKGPF